MEGGESREECFGAGSVAGAVIGTLLTTLLLVGVAAVFYKQWRRHKGKHLVLVTDPETVDDAYAFDNPCFRDATPATAPRIVHKPTTPTSAEKESKWAWTTLGISSLTRGERKSLDDSCLGPKATKVSVVSLRSHDFTGLGFNICGNMREGIFVKDLLHRGPASESGKVHAGDRITSVRISFRAMVYEDALTILSYASPYDVELELETSQSKPSSLLKKTVSPTAGRLCHPLYRSQSILDLNGSTAGKGRRLYTDGPDSMSALKKKTPQEKGPKLYIDNNDTASTLKSVKKNLMKVGIKVLPSPENGASIENQNEHNRNLERSCRIESLIEEKGTRRSSTGHMEASQKTGMHLDGENSRQVIDSESLEIANGESSKFAESICTLATSNREGSIQRDSAKKLIHRTKSSGPEENSETLNSLDRESSARVEETDYVSRSHPKSLDESLISGFRNGDGIAMNFGSEEQYSLKGEQSVLTFIPSEVPKEVHNAAMAARKNRKSCSDLLNNHKTACLEETIRTPPRNKRKAPPPPVNQPTVCYTLTNSQPPISNSSPIPPLVFATSSPTSQVMSTVSSSSLESLKSEVDKYSSLEITRDDGPDSFDESGHNNDKIVDPLRGYRGNLASQFKEDDRSDSDGECDKCDRLTRIEVNPEDITVHRTIELEEMEIDRKAASLDDLSTFVQTSRLLRAQSLEMSPCARKRKAPPPPSDNQSPARLRKAAEWGNLQDALDGLSMQEDLVQESISREDSLDRRVLKRSKSENLNPEEEKKILLCVNTPVSLSFEVQNKDLSSKPEKNQKRSKSMNLHDEEIGAHNTSVTPPVFTELEKSNVTTFPEVVQVFKGSKSMLNNDEGEAAMDLYLKQNNVTTVNAEVTITGASQECTPENKEKCILEEVVRVGSPSQNVKSTKVANDLKSLTEDIKTPVDFDPEEDNALAMIMNDGVVIKSPTVEEVELDFRRSTPLPDDELPDYKDVDEEEEEEEEVSNFDRSLKYFQDKSNSTETQSLNSSSKADSKENLDTEDMKIMSNGKPASGRKPPVPPRRVDIGRAKVEKLGTEHAGGTNGRSE